MQIASIGLKRIPEVFKIAPIIRFCKETRSAVITALNDVLRDTGQLKPGLSWHGSPPCERRSKINLITAWFCNEPCQIIMILY